MSQKPISLGSPWNNQNAHDNFTELYDAQFLSISDKAADFDISVEETRGTKFICSAAAAGTLPAIAAGMHGSIEAGQGVTAIIQLIPPAATYIVVDGVRGTVATALASAGGAGDRIEWWAVSATDIHIRTIGTWGE